MTPAGERPARAERLERACDRVLVGSSLAGSVIAALLTWYAVVRSPGPLSGLYLLLVVVLGATALIGLAWLPFRQRVYARLPAPKLLAIELSLLLPLLLVEGVANLANPRGYLYFAESARYFQWQRFEDVAVSHAHPPNGELSFPWGTIRTNREGWRAPDVAEQPAADTLRVLALGDSVVFGWGVDQEQSLCPSIERALGERLGRKVEVLNTGNGSYDTVDELVVFKERGLAYRPQAVFLVCVENDFGRAPYKDQVAFLASIRPENPRLIPALEARAIERPPRVGPSGGFARSLFYGVSYLVNRSFLLQSAASAMRHSGRRAAPAAPAKGGAGGASSAPTPPSLDALLARFPYLKEHTEALREVALTCRAREIPLVVFLFDSGGRQEHHAWLRSELKAVAPVVELEFPADRPRAELVNSTTDGHWNAAGSAWFGGKIAEALAERLKR